jgi:hypothetical protein
MVGRHGFRCVRQFRVLTAQCRQEIEPGKGDEVGLIERADACLASRP